MKVKNLLRIFDEKQLSPLGISCLLHVLYSSNVPPHLVQRGHARRVDSVDVDVDADAAQQAGHRLGVLVLHALLEHHLQHRDKN